MGRREQEQLKADCDAAANIVAVVGASLPLKAAGREFKTLCPFHDDHKPSLCVVPHKQIFHCFSCGAGGDQYTFIQKYHGLNFPDTMREVARLLGIATDGEQIKHGDREVRQVAKPKPVEMMSRKDILEEWKWYRDNAYPPQEWAEKLGVDPVAMEVTRMVAAPYRRNQAWRVLVAPMRDAEGTLCSLRFRNFESKDRWSLCKKEKVSGKWVIVARTASGVMTCDETFDSDICLIGLKDLIVEGETDLLGAITIILRNYDKDPIDWPARVIAIPGVLACHDLILSMKLASVVVTVFDLDKAGSRAAFNHKPMKLTTNEDGARVHVINHDAKREPGLLAKLKDKGVQSRACFPPESEDGSKYDLRDMAREGWTWDRLEEHMLSNCTADPNGRRHKR